ncbi:MAG: SNF2-related protein [Spirochaetota bacterium]
MNIGVDISSLSLASASGLTYTVKLEVLHNDGRADYISGIRDTMRAFTGKDAALQDAFYARYGGGRERISDGSRELIGRIAQYAECGGKDDLFGFTPVFRGSIDDRLFFEGETAHDFMNFIADYPFVDAVKQSPVLTFAAGGDISFAVSAHADTFSITPVFSADGKTYPHAELFWYGRHLFAGRTVYTPSCDVRSLAQLFGVSSKDPRAKPMIVTRDSFPSFMRKIHPVLARIASIALPEDFGGDVPSAVPVIYLDEDGHVRGHLSFRYGGEACAVPGVGERYILPENVTCRELPSSHRDERVEAKAIDMFRSLFGGATLFGADGMEETNTPFGISFSLTDDRSALRFVREIYPLLTLRGFETCVSRSFTRFSSIRELTLTASVDDAGDWFSVRFAIDGISPEDVRAVMKAIRVGRTSIRLSDGTLAGIASDGNRRMTSLIDGLGVVIDGDAARIERSHIPLIMALASHPENIALGKGALHVLASFSEAPPPVAAGNGLEDILRHYQSEGVAFLAHRSSLGLNCILADDMGLGKTLMALAFLAHLHRKNKRPLLVVCPSSLVFNWENEAKRFVSGLRIAALSGSPESRASSFASDADLYITSYASMVNDIAMHRERTYAAVVLDEAQQIKNHESQRARLVRELTADVRLALTGTPIENRILELWSIGDFLMPGIFGERASFEKRYGSLAAGDAGLDMLRAQLKTFVLRRTKTEVAPELPPRIETTLVCDLYEEQKKLYLAVREQAVSDVKKVFAERGKTRSYLSIFAALTKLKQVVCHPALVASLVASLVAPLDAVSADGVPCAESAKTDLFLELADELSRSGRRALVFSQYTSMLDILSKALDERGYAHLRLDGSTKDRGDVVAAFQRDDGPPFFLISLRAGGTGLTLTAADTVILYDLWWNPAVERQAADRAHRIGQTKTVNIYRLIARGTIEERILALQAKKAALADSLIDEESFSKSTLTEDDIAMLLGND